MNTMVRCALMTGIVAFFALPPVAAASVIKVYLMAGQSNMDGAGLVAGLQPPYSEPQPAIKFWNNATHSWAALQPGIGANTSAEFGPELSFGYAMHNALPDDDIYLIKYAVGATSLAYDWNPNGSGWCYNNFKSVASAALNTLRGSGTSPTIAGMLWMQGESDAYIGMASAYAGNLTNFIGRVRSDFATPDMPFVLGRINSYSWGTPDDNNLVRTAQMSVPAEVGHASWINTDDLPLSYAGHFNTQGQVTLGNRFAGQLAPEPGGLTLLAIGVAGIVVHASRKRSRLTDCR
jgi:hypothetical protein